MTEQIRIEFVRSAEELVDVMIDFNRRLQDGFANPKTKRLRSFGGGAAIGLASMFLISRLDLEAIANSMTARKLLLILSILLMLILYDIILFAWYPWAVSKYRKAMIGRMAQDQNVSVAADSKGIVTEGPASRFELDWSEVRSIKKCNDRLELETETLIVFIPQRAFADKASFDQMAARLETLRENSSK